MSAAVAFAIAATSAGVADAVLLDPTVTPIPKFVTPIVVPPTMPKVYCSFARIGPA